MTSLINYKTIIAQIVNMSPTARKIFDDERYTLGLQDPTQIDDEKVLNGVIQGLEKDLNEFGIHFTTSLDDVFCDWYIGTQVLNLFELVLPTTLYRKLISDKTLRSGIESLLAGAGDIDEPILLSYLTYLKDYNEFYGGQHHRAIEHLEDKIASDELYGNVLENLLKLDPEADHEPVEVDRMRAFLSILEDMSLRYESVLAILNDTNTQGASLLRKRARMHIDRFTLPDAVNKWSWYFVEYKTKLAKGDTPTEQETKIANDLLKAHHLTSPLYLEHYELLKLTPSTIDLIGVLVAIAAETLNRADFDRKVKDFSIKTATAGYLTADIKSAITRVHGYIVSNVEFDGDE